jgi:predicted MPP superfamily phosphohydrolase
MSFVLRIIIVFILIYLLEFYFIKKAANSFKHVFSGLKCKKCKTPLILLLLFLNLYPFFLLVFHLLGSELPDSRLTDYSLVFPFWAYALIVIQCSLLFLLMLVIKGLLYPVYKKNKTSYLNYENKIVFLLIFYFVLYVPARIIFDYNTVSVRNVVYKKHDLNPALNNFRIVFISDIHADRHTGNKRLGNYISKVNKLHPDLVLIGGDLISSTPQYIETAAEYMGMIKSKYGVFSCRGDHDHWAYRPDLQRSINAVTDELEKYNIPMLNNENKILDVKKSKILISFISYTYPEKIRQDDLDSLLSVKKQDLNIVLCHQPEGGIPQEASENNYDLMLAGHTHGGQITFLFPFFNLSPTLIETKYVRGNFNIGNMLLVVTRGLGMSLVPFRLNSTPEITVITIKPY